MASRSKLSYWMSEVLDTRRYNIYKYPRICVSTEVEKTMRSDWSKRDGTSSSRIPIEFSSIVRIRRLDPCKAWKFGDRFTVTEILTLSTSQFLQFLFKLHALSNSTERAFNFNTHISSPSHT